MCTYHFSLDETQVAELQDRLAEKDELLTETRLEALNSAAQLQALRETVAKLRAELNGMKKGEKNSTLSMAILYVLESNK